MKSVVPISDYEIHCTLHDLKVEVHSYNLMLPVDCQLYCYSSVHMFRRERVIILDIGNIFCLNFNKVSVLFHPFLILNQLVTGCGGSSE